MSISLDDLPRVDCHAHIAPDVTDRQVRALGDVFVFAVTRSLAEASTVPTHRYPQLVWGCGVHPRDSQAVAQYEEDRFRTLVTRFVMIGEIGLDAAGPNFQAQAHVLGSILRIVSALPVVCSIHSAGRAREVVDLLAKHRPKGAILHWFVGDDDLVAAAVQLGCCFSVNVAMTDGQLAALPRDRVLPETDFPARRTRSGSKRPGDVAAVEERLSRVWGESPLVTRMQLLQNLRDIAVRSDTLDRLPDGLADALIAV